ncbi:MAG: hypothetical protein WC508_01775 [Patescibacteria group bacterium]
MSTYLILRQMGTLKNYNETKSEFVCILVMIVAFFLIIACLMIWDCCIKTTVSVDYFIEATDGQVREVRHKTRIIEERLANMQSKESLKVLTRISWHYAHQAELQIVLPDGQTRIQKLNAPSQPLNECFIFLAPLEGELKVRLKVDGKRNFVTQSVLRIQVQ